MSAPLQFSVGVDAAAKSSSSSSAAPTSASEKARISIKATPGIQTAKRAKDFAEHNLRARQETFNKRRRGHENANAAGAAGDANMATSSSSTAPSSSSSSSAGPAPPVFTPQQVQTLLSEYVSCYLIATAPNTNTVTGVSLNPSVPSALRASRLQSLRLLLSNDDAPLDEVILSGAIPLLISELGALTPSEQSAATQMDALWCLTNIASGTTDQTRAVLPAAPTLINLLSGASVKLQEQCVWCLGNLASEEQECRMQLIENGILVPLVRLIQGGVPAALPPAPQAVPAPSDASALSFLRIVLWTLSNLVKSSKSAAKIAAGAAAGEAVKAKHAAAFANVAPTLLPALLALLRSTDEQLATESSWTLSAWANHSDAVLQSLVSAGLVPALLSRLMILQQSSTARGSGVVIDTATGIERDPLAPALIPVVRIIGNAAHANDAIVQSILSFQFPATAAPTAVPNSFHLVFSTLDRAFSSIHRGLRKEVAWVLSNLAATTLQPVHDALVLNDKGGPSVFLFKLLELVRKGNFDLQREAVHSLYNMARMADGRLMHVVLPRAVTASTADGSMGATEQILHCCFDFLRSRDPEATLVSLRLIELALRRHPDGKQIVEEQGGIDALESVQTALENADLVSYAQGLVDEFYGEGEEEIDMAPEDSSDANQQHSQEEYPPWRVQQTPPKPSASSNQPMQPPAGGFQF